MTGGARRALAVDSEPLGEVVRERLHPKIGRRPKVSLHSPPGCRRFQSTVFMFYRLEGVRRQPLVDTTLRRMYHTTLSV